MLCELNRSSTSALDGIGTMPITWDASQLPPSSSPPPAITFTPPSMTNDQREPKKNKIKELLSGFFDSKRENVRMPDG
jgi:hypothetical protein